MEMNQQQSTAGIHQILLKLLDGTHRFLNFTVPIITAHSLKQHIQTLTSVPSRHQLLLLHGQALLTDDHEILNLNGNYQSEFPLVVHLLLRLRGGKGGFGSLLRGAATKAGQKKTNNFDACRDMSGRRLRHVNAEKKLEEWKAEAEERKLEKIAEEFIKKKAKEMVKSGKGKAGGVDTDKYVQKYREDSAKCMEEVERSVRESLKGIVSSSLRKRQGTSETNDSDAKRFKIWVGKRKVADSDSEDSDEDVVEENKSVVIDNGDQSDSSKEADGSSGSVTEARCDIVSSDTGPSGSGSEVEKDNTVEESQAAGRGAIDHVETAIVVEVELGSSEQNTLLDPERNKFSLQESGLGTGTNQAEKELSKGSCLPDASGRVGQARNIFISGEDEAPVVGASNDPMSNLAMHDEVVTVICAEVLDMANPLSFEEINSAAELEVLGLERLKSELQARGLKCGGTLQERAARLFLLKTTPVEMLPKKLLAKK